MDARSFANYLKNKLIHKSKEYENSLLSASYETIADAKRISGIRDTLVGISNSVDNVVAEFYDNGGNKLPDPCSTTKDI